MKVIDNTTYATARSSKNKSNLPTKAAIIKEKIYTPHNVNRGNASSNTLRSIFIIYITPLSRADVESYRLVKKQSLQAKELQVERPKTPFLG